MFGGNLDNRGSWSRGARCICPSTSRRAASIGDGHAVQGYGEVCLSAVEASLKGEIQVVLHKGRRHTLAAAPRPRRTTSRWGFDADLDEAAKIATREMLDFLVETQRAVAGRTRTCWRARRWIWS